ncbi:hypothetical protein [Nonomuraea dietziae]|uniref:hypothetical protein n=1 Tax=Nonomuraea dietziae TaxID=65515 RepID=UPI0031E26529
MRHLAAALTVAALTLTTGAAALADRDDPEPAVQAPEQDLPSVSSLKVTPGTSKGTGRLIPIAGGRPARRAPGRGRRLPRQDRDRHAQRRGQAPLRRHVRRDRRAADRFALDAVQLPAARLRTRRETAGRRPALHPQG